MDTITITRTVIGPEIKVSLNYEVVGIAKTLQYSDGDYKHNIVRIGELFINED
jgi:hypothetical protein